MRLCILLLVGTLFLPRVVASSDYIRIANPMRVVESKNGTSVVTERTERFKRLYFFIASHSAAKNPLYITEVLINCPYPELMAVIASVESGFDPEAVGPDGEVSIFQILEWPGGDPTDLVHALNEAIRVFEEKKSGRSFAAAVKAYNGTGYRAERYKDKVLTEIKQIKTMRI